MLETHHILFSCVDPKDRLQSVGAHCRAATAVMFYRLFQGFLNELPCTGGGKERPTKTPEKKSEAADRTSVPLLCRELVLSKVNIFLPSLVCGGGEGVCGIYQAFTNETKIKLNVFYFHLHSDKYRLQGVLRFSCPGLKLVESKI